MVFASATWHPQLSIEVHRISEKGQFFNPRFPHRRQPTTRPGLPRNGLGSTRPHGSFHPMKSADAFRVRRTGRRECGGERPSDPTDPHPSPSSLQGPGIYELPMLHFAGGPEALQEEVSSSTNRMRGLLCSIATPTKVTRLVFRFSGHTTASSVNTQSFHKCSGTLATSTVTGTCGMSKYSNESESKCTDPLKIFENHRRQMFEVIDFRQYGAVFRLGTTADKCVYRMHRP